MLQLNDFGNLFDAIELAWTDTVDAIAQANTQAIESVRYDWPRSTTRSDGTVVTSPRDIVDTGHLRDSQQLTRSGDDFKIEWAAEAFEVHEGIDNKPPRRWTQQAIKGDHTAPLEWQNPEAILDVPTHFTSVFKAIYQPSRR
jgi:hypothetical protein